MVKQNLSALFNELRDNNNSGSREYRLAELLAPMVGTGAPTADALFIGQEYVDTTEGSEEQYFSVSVGSGAADWTKMGVGV